MPRVGSSSSRTRRVGGQPFSDDHLLLVAARQRSDPLPLRPRLDAQSGDEIVRQRPQPGKIDQQEPRQPIEHGKGQILGHRPVEHQAALAPLLRHQPETGADRRPWRSEADGLAVEQHLALVGRRQTEQTFEEFAAACAEKPGQAENLATMRSRSMPKNWPRTVRFRTESTTSPPLRSSACRRFERAADHQSDELVLVTSAPGMVAMRCPSRITLTRSAISMISANRCDT